MTPLTVGDLERAEAYYDRPLPLLRFDLFEYQRT